MGISAGPAGMTAGGPPLIAVVGCDGSGRTSVAGALRDWLAQERRTALCDLGDGSGRTRGGGGLAEAIDRRIARARTDEVPGLLDAFLLAAAGMRRLRRFRRMLALRSQGYAIVADRFPQMARPGPLDGMAFAAAGQRSMILRALARRERARFRWMTAHRPDLVARLNVSPQAALARKPGADPAVLTRQLADLTRLDCAGAPIVDIDAERPLLEVQAKAREAVRAALAAGGGVPQRR